MVSPVPWPAAASLASGAISIYFIRYLWPYRSKPGARFFIATIACEALWALAYGAALFVFDPVLRRTFEIPIWIGVNFIGVFFLAFALEYTGRGHIVRSPWMVVIGGIQVLHTIVVITNPLHHIAWSGYHIDPIYGAATVSYVHQPWLFVNFAGILLTVAAGAFLLVDTFFSYGRLYRTQAVALALSPTLPGLAFLLWLVELGQTPPLNLTPLTFPVHLGFDMYAFFRRNMFEMTPAARRAGDRAAIDDLGSAVIIVDDDGRVINLNSAAEELLDGSKSGVLGQDVHDLLPPIDPDEEGQSVTLTTREGNRDFAVATSRLEDSAGTHVGYTIVLQDITSEKRREQRLMVLNRVLRHNLRNDLNVVHGNIQIAAEHATDEESERALSIASEKTGEVMDLGETARQIERTIDEDGAVEEVEIGALLEGVVGEFDHRDRDATIETDCPDGVRLRTDPRLLDGVLTNLVENAIDHNDGPDPRVDIDVERVGTGLKVEVRDNGPGIPEHERAVIERGEESALQHGSGLGLWYVKWALDMLGGDLTFDVSNRGTTVTLHLPGKGDEGSTGPVGRSSPE